MNISCVVLVAAETTLVVILARVTTISFSASAKPEPAPETIVNPISPGLVCWRAGHLLLASLRSQVESFMHHYNRSLALPAFNLNRICCTLFHQSQFPSSVSRVDVLVCFPDPVAGLRIS